MLTQTITRAQDRETGVDNCEDGCHRTEDIIPTDRTMYLEPNEVADCKGLESPDAAGHADDDGVGAAQ